MEHVPVSWPDPIPGWPLRWMRTSTSQRPQSSGVQRTFPNTCADVARVWRQLVPAACRWVPRVSATSQAETPKAAGALRQRLCRARLKVLVCPNRPFHFGGDLGHGSSVMQRQLQLPLQKRFPSANELFMSKVNE